MDNSSLIVGNKLKKEVKDFLLDRIITDLQSGKMDLIAKKESARFILKNMSLVKNYQDLILFLETLKSRWPNFTDVYNIYKNRFYQEKEKVIIDKLTSYLHKLN